MKSHSKFISLSLFSALIFFISCKKDSSNSTNADVYISGTIGNKATLWKNGVASVIGDGNSNPGKIVLSDGDVYISGGSRFTEAGNAFYYKNGARIDLGTGATNAIAVNGPDVYLAGSAFTNLYDEAVYWKNNTVTNLGFGDAYAITISGNDIYLAGRTFKDSVSAPIYATYWKNGNPTYLGLGQANAIAVQGNDVYVAGFFNTGPSTPVGGYWKNGIFVQIQDSADAEVNDIKLSGTDIYLAGSVFVSGYTCAAVWKNGIVTIYENNSIANGLTLSGNDIYVVGGHPNIPCMWKNNVISALAGNSTGNNLGQAISVFVVAN